MRSNEVGFVSSGDSLTLWGVDLVAIDYVRVHFMKEDCAFAVVLFIPGQITVINFVINFVTLVPAAPLIPS